MDTRRLTRHIRKAGAMPGANGTADESTLLAAAKKEPGTSNIDLVAEVTCPEPYFVPATRNNGTHNKKIVALDFGIKRNILRLLVKNRCEVKVLPAQSSLEETFLFRLD